MDFYKSEEGGSLPSAGISAFGRNFGLRPKFFFSYREFPNFLKKKLKTNPRPKCIGGFHYRGNLQNIVSMPFGKGNYFFKTILEKKKLVFFFFFFFEIFEKKKALLLPKHAASWILLI